MKGADGRAVLRCWPVDVDVAGCVYRIEGRPAIDWVLKLVEERWLSIVPGMVVGDEIDDRISDGVITTPMLVAAGREVAELVTGMRWWAACRILNATVSNVELAGALVLAGVDPARVSIGAYVAATYRLMMMDRDDKQRASLDADIMRVPRGVPTGQVYDPRAAGDAFERMYAQQPRG